MNKIKLVKILIVFTIITWLIRGKPIIWRNPQIPPRNEAYAGTQTFTSSGTWVAPNGVTGVTVKARGGGGGGASVKNTGGGGGGGGAYSEGVVSVTPGNSYNVIVGAQVNQEVDGNPSYFGDGSVVKAAGGSTTTTATGAAGGSSNPSYTIGTVVYEGGGGGNGHTTGDVGGGGGGGAGSDGNGGTGGTATANTPGTGGVGGTGGGNGGNGGPDGGTGGTGSAPGGGGGGAETTGGIGARGEVYLEWNLSPSVTLNTADENDFGTDYTPVLEFTGSDPEGNSIRYNIQIDSSNEFSSAGGIIDYHSESNVNYDSPIGKADINNLKKIAQSFTGDGNTITSTKFYLKKTGTPTNILSAKIYAHTGTYGVDGKPTGSPIISSNSYPASSLTTSYQLIDFSFPTTYQTTDGTNYITSLEINGVNDSNYVLVGYDASTPTHSGNLSHYYDMVELWTVVSGTDASFYVLSAAPLLNKLSGTDPGFINTINESDDEPYISGDKVSYTVQESEALSTGGTFYWRVRAKDPAGSNSYGSWSSTRSFTITGATIAVSLSTDGSISYGTLPSGDITDTTSGDLNDTQIVTNDSSIPVDLNIKTGSAVGGTSWGINSSPGVNKYVHEFSTNGGSGWTKFITSDSYQLLASGVAVAGSQPFDLRITLPTASDGVGKSINIVVQAVAP